MTIRQKLFAVVLISVGVCIASGAVYFLVRAPISRINSEQQVLSSLGASIRTQTIALDRLASAEFPPELKRFMASSADTSAAFGRLDSLTLLPGLSQSVADALDAIRAQKSVLDKGVSDFLLTVTNVQFDAKKLGLDEDHFRLLSLLAPHGPDDDPTFGAARADTNQMFLQLDALSSVLISASGVLDTQTGAIRTTVAKIEQRSDVTAIGIGVLLIGFTFVLALFITGRIVRTVRSIEGGIDRMSGGDLTVGFNVRSRDEIGRLCDDLNQFISTLRDSVGTAQTVSHENVEIKQQLITSTEETARIARHIATSAESVDTKTSGLSDDLRRSGEAVSGISKNIQRLNEQIQEQTAMVEESTASVTQMIASIENSSRIADERRNATSGLVMRIESGGKQLDSAFDHVRQISERIVSIKEITSIIDGISAQTNLLAMNAAIEAAHAGDAGRGFSVVADEIGKLSTATSKNSREIGKILGDMVSGISEADASAEQMSTTFHEILNDTQAHSDAMMEIFSSMNELRSGSDQILQAMSALRDSSVAVRDGSINIRSESGQIQSAMQAVQQVSAEVRRAMEQITEDMDGISSGVRNVLTIAEKLGSLGETLNSELSRFVTEAAAAT